MNKLKFWSTKVDPTSEWDEVLVSTKVSKISMLTQTDRNEVPSQ